MHGVICSLVMAANAAAMAPVPDQWTLDYREALNSARIASRPLLVILEDPQDPARRVDQLHPGDGTELGQLLMGFELCRVDINTDYGKKVAEAYGATEFPFTAITDESCQTILFRGMGKLSPKLWTSTLAFYTGKSADVRITRVRRRSRRSPSRIFGHANLRSALAASHNRRRPLFVFVTMVGCRYCDKMKTETFTDASIRSHLSSEFESVVVQQTDEPDWVHEQGVRIFPTTIILSPNGKPIDQIDGFKSPAELESRLKTAEDQVPGKS